AKLITHGENRKEAIVRMIRAIDDYEITGVQTTLPFCKFALQHQAFTSGNFDTHFVHTYFHAGSLDQGNDQEMKLAAVLAWRAFSEPDKINKKLPSSFNHSKWKGNRAELRD